MTYLSLKIGDQEVNAPEGIPTGGTGTLESTFRAGIWLLYLIAIVLALVYLIWGGFDWLRSEGDKTKV